MRQKQVRPASDVSQRLTNCGELLISVRELEQEAAAAKKAADGAKAK